MKPILAFLAAFIVAAGASAGAKMMLTKPTHIAKAGADSTKVGVDSTTRDSPSKTQTLVATDSAHAKPAVAEAPRANPAATIGKTPGFAASSTLVNNGVKSVVKPVPAAPKVPSAPAVGDTVAEASERRLAKVFTAMEPKQAAKVLQHMADSDVQIILGYVGPRQAASIMAELPPERVATLSKLSMQAKGTK